MDEKKKEMGEGLKGRGGALGDFLYKGISINLGGGPWAHTDADS